MNTTTQTDTDDSLLPDPESLFTDTLVTLDEAIMHYVACERQHRAARGGKLAARTLDTALAELAGAARRVRTALFLVRDCSEGGHA